MIVVFKGGLVGVLFRLAPEAAGRLPDATGGLFGNDGGFDAAIGGGFDAGG